MAIVLFYDDSGLRVRTFFSSFDTIVKEELEQVAADLLLPAIRDKIIQNRSVFTRDLLEGIDSQKIRTSTGPGIKVGASSVPYALSVEKGTGPQASVNYNKILRWVEDKNGLVGNEARKVAAAVVKTLKSKGAIAHPYLLAAFEDVRDEFTRRFLRRTRKRLRGK